MSSHYIASITEDKMIKEERLYKNELYSKGMRVLRDSLGSLDTAEFIAGVKSDRFDYTEWQRKHFDRKSPEQISSEAEDYVLRHPYTGDAASVL